jgi:hypothetical protein
LTPVDWLEKDYDRTFHPTRRITRRESAEHIGLIAYIYVPDGLAGYVGGTMFSLKTDQEELYSRDLGWFNPDGTLDSR